MARDRIKLNSREIQSYLDGNHGVEAQLRERAEKILAAAQSEAQAYVKTGNYLDGLAITEDHTDRLVLRVGSSAPHAHLVEAAHGTLARALDAGA